MSRRIDVKPILAGPVVSNVCFGRAVRCIQLFLWVVPEGLGFRVLSWGSAPGAR